MRAHTSCDNDINIRWLSHIFIILIKLSSTSTKYHHFTPIHRGLVIWIQLQSYSLKGWLNQLSPWWIMEESSIFTGFYNNSVMIFLETIRKVIFKYYSVQSWNRIELVQIMSKVIFVISFLLLQKVWKLEKQPDNQTALIHHLWSGSKIIFQSRT